MDDALRGRFQQIGEQVDHLMDEVENALDEHAEFSFTLQTRAQVDEVAQQYRAACAELTDEKDKFEAERRWGRKVIDLQKLAQRLPTPPKGKPATQRASNDFFETREGKSSRQPVVPGLQAGQVSSRKQEKPKYRVSGDVDAWCGPCADIKTHTIIAMVGDEPAQVVCQVCNSRHKFRSETGRARKTDGNGGTASASATGGGVAAQPGDRKMVERNALVAELRAAPNVKPFSPKDRYRVGEIIEHPEHGRGKIENTLPRSLLVRFPSGLKRFTLS